MRRRSQEHASFLSAFSLLSYTSLLICCAPALLAQEVLPQAPVRSGPGTVASQAAAVQIASNSQEESYRIGPGDLLDIRVFHQGDLSSTARVNAQGLIRLPFIGDVRAACLTEGELARFVAEKYRKYINEPQVDVFIKEYESQPVAVIGAVDKPARFQLQRRVRLLELLTFAGGPTKEAGYTVHVIHGGNRSVCDPESAGNTGTVNTGEDISFSSFKLSELLSGNPTANIYIMPGDVVSVPEADEVFVTGMVVKPGPVQMIDRTTLTQAVAMAGGPTPEAGKKVRLLRKKSGGSVIEEQVYDITDIQKKKIEDVLLQSGDVVDVTNSAGRSVAQSLLKQIAPTLGIIPLVLGR